MFKRTPTPCRIGDIDDFPAVVVLLTTMKLGAVEFKKYLLSSCWTDQSILLAVALLDTRLVRRKVLLLLRQWGKISCSTSAFSFQELIAYFNDHSLCSPYVMGAKLSSKPIIDVNSDTPSKNKEKIQSERS